MAGDVSPVAMFLIYTTPCHIYLVVGILFSSLCDILSNSASGSFQICWCRNKHSVTTDLSKKWRWIFSKSNALVAPLVLLIVQGLRNNWAQSRSFGLINWSASGTPGEKYGTGSMSLNKLKHVRRSPMSLRHMKRHCNALRHFQYNHEITTELTLNGLNFKLVDLECSADWSWHISEWVDLGGRELETDLGGRLQLASTTELGDKWAQSRSLSWLQCKRNTWPRNFQLGNASSSLWDTLSNNSNGLLGPGQETLNQITVRPRCGPWPWLWMGWLSLWWAKWADLESQRAGRS